MAFFRFFSVCFCIVCTTASAFSEDGFDFFIEACRHSGYNPGEISSFQAEMKIVSQTFYPDSVIARRKKEMSEKLATFSNNRDESQRAKSEAEMKESLDRMFSGDVRTECVRISLRNTAAPLGLKDDLGVVLLEDTVKQRASLFQRGTEYVSVGNKPSIGIKERVSLSQPFGKDTTLVDGKTRIGNNGSQHYAAGRAKSLVTKSALRKILASDDTGNIVFSDSGITDFKNACEKVGWTFTLTGEKMVYDNAHTALQLDIYEKGKIRERLWIDPTRDYICPKERIFHLIDGTILSESTSVGYMLEENSQKWFPEKVTFSMCFEGKPGEKILTEMEVRITPQTLVINRPIPDSVFALSVEKGARVDDFRRDDNGQIAFYANQTDKLDLKTVENRSLDDISWLAPKEVRQIHDPPSPSAFGWTRVVLISSGLLFIAIALFKIWKDKRRLQ